MDPAKKEREKNYNLFHISPFILFTRVPEKGVSVNARSINPSLHDRYNIQFENRKYMNVIVAVVSCSYPSHLSTISFFVSVNEPACRR